MIGVSQSVFVGLAVGASAALIIFAVGSQRVWIEQRAEIAYLKTAVDRQPVSPLGVPSWEVTCDNLVDRAAFDLAGPGLPGMEVRCDVEDPSGKLHFATKSSPNGQLTRFHFPMDFAGGKHLAKGSYRVRWFIRSATTDLPIDVAEGTFEIRDRPQWKL